MEKWVGRVALVTGASSGIGEATCQMLVKNGMTVVGAARRGDKMKALAESLLGEKGELIPFQCDISNDSEVYALFNYINDKYGGLDVCINNAGIAAKGSLMDGDPEDWRKMFNVNVIALILCTKLAIKSMKQKDIDDGYIINIGSICGHIVFNSDNLHSYTSSKFAVRAATDGFRQELKARSSGIRITLLSPGLIETDMTSKVMSAIRNDPNSKTVSMLTEDITRMLAHILSSPSRVEISDIKVEPTFNISF